MTRAGEYLSPYVALAVDIVAVGDRYSRRGVSARAWLHVAAAGAAGWQEARGGGGRLGEVGERLQWARARGT